MQTGILEDVLIRFLYSAQLMGKVIRTVEPFPCSFESKFRRRGALISSYARDNLIRFPVRLVW